MITTAPETLHLRATALAGRLQAAGILARVVNGFSAVGGGSAPGITLPASLVEVAIAGASTSTLEAALRGLDTPVVARIENDRVVLDLRTVIPDEDEELIARLVEAKGVLEECASTPPSASGDCRRSSTSIAGRGST